jgi:hypothetical protein
MRVNSEGKSPSAVLARKDQDYFALRQYAAGEWCMRGGDNTRWDTCEYLILGTVREWRGPFDLDHLLLLQNIEHHNCIYFLDTATFQTSYRMSLPMG